MGFTPEQQDAIDATGRVIVSASAGSGKTTVMIEKIIGLIKNDAKVSELLAVTFTKKAASQMKEKLAKALMEAINSEDVDAEKRKNLKKQLAEVSAADISTIHSFCAKLIRANFFAAGVDNAFRVIGGDDAEGTALKGEALNQLLEEGYEDGDEDFAHLLSVYWRKKSDKSLRKTFLETYGKLRDRADYKEYLQRSMEYDENTFQGVCKDLYDLFEEKFRYYLDLIENEKIYFEEIQAVPQVSLAVELCTWIEELLSEQDYFCLANIPKPQFTKKQKSKKDSAEKAIHIERLAFLKDRVIDAYEKEVLVIGKEDEERAAFLRSARTARALAKYLLKFDGKYAELKREKGVLDYNDLEHIALALLQNEEISAEIKKKYRYVFVDEYQDVNPVQEAIVAALSGENLFLVGDVKQSIYGFRGSKSKFFVEKQRKFDEGEGKSLKMKSNFRSSDQVLDAVNKQFSLAMTPHTSDVDYAKDSIMEKGGRYPVNSGKVQIHYLPKEKKEVGERGVYSVKERAENAENTEASQTAKLIHKIISQERMNSFYDADKGEHRTVQYSDIAVLSRKKQGQIEETVAALAELGVPISAAVAVNICDYAEIKTLIDILQLLDNAEQDVPLCSALLSSMGDVTANELVEIRLAYKSDKSVKSFREACKKYSEEKTDFIAHKLRKFYAYYEDARTLSHVLNAGEIISRILSETRMEANLLSRDNGRACLKRIHRFIEETLTPEPMSVHAFLDKLRDMDYKIEYSENGGEDSVKVLTMHSSKGLEYPVVILDNLAAKFRGADHDEVLVEEKYGLAPRSFDEERLTKKQTVLRRLNALKEVRGSIADELNLYYVALTRAKHTLHMIFESRLSMSDVKYAKSFAELTDFGVWEEYETVDEIFDVEKQERTALVFHPDEALAQKIMGAFEWRYDYAGYENLPVKSSATQLLEAQEAAENTAEIAYAAADNSEMEAEVREVGTAYHAFLEKFDFSVLYEGNGARISKEKLEEIIERSLESGDALMTALVDKEKLLEILSNPVFYELQDMRLHKEQQFLVSLPVSETYAKKAGVAELLVGKSDGEEMIFQGAIDLLAVGEKVRIIDYKYSAHGKEYLKEHYKPQLDLYRLAAAKILRKEPAEIQCSIVNIRLGFQVDM